MLMKRFFLLILMLGVFACSRTQGKRTHGNDETTSLEVKEELPAELNVQLEAMGYPAPEKRTRHLSPKENPYENADLASHMDDIPATFVFLDVNRDIQLVHNRDRAVTRFSPCSTYKIPNTLIALDTGVMKNAESKIPWDKKKYPKQPFWDDLKTQFGLNWETDHTLESAFQNSCVWCYTEIAEQIGLARMQKYISRFNYGNMDIDSGAQPFWLDSSLQISAVEQVSFLKRFVQNDLGLSEPAVQNARRVFKREQKNDATLYAKTGSGNNIGWFVGFVEAGTNQYIFAFNMDKNAFSKEAFARKRISIPTGILAELGVWL